MRLPVGAVANAVAWGVLFGLLGIAFVMVWLLGPIGLGILGLLVLFICTSLELNDDVPSGQVNLMQGQLRPHHRPEERAARDDEKRDRLAPLPFCRTCGLLLLVAGVLGFIWQSLQ